MSASHTSPSDRSSDGVRLRSTGLGHVYVSESGPREGETPVYIHRLAGVAWGVIDSLAESTPVRHEVPAEWLADDVDPADDGVPWLNVEDAIRAAKSDDQTRSNSNHD